MKTSEIPGWDSITHVINRDGIDTLRRYVKQDSISCGDPQPVPPGITNMVGIIRTDLAAIDGATVDVVRTNSYPVAIASIPASKHADTAPTLLLYNMADTRPIGNRQEWNADPFGCETLTVDGQERIIGRGTLNSKSGLAGMIDVVRLLRKFDALPVNLEIIIDFEEEVRVDGVIEVLATHKERLKNCRAAFMPFCGEAFDAIWLGCKGVAVVQAKLKTNRSVTHSGLEAYRKPSALPNEFFCWVKSIIKHDCFRFDFNEQDSQLAKQLADDTDRDSFAKSIGVQGRELRSRYIEDLILASGRPHINLLAWKSEQCEGALPSWATADLEFRIPPTVTLNGREIEKKITEYLDDMPLLNGVTLESVKFIAGTGPAGRFASPDDLIVRSLQKSYKTFDVDMPLSPCCPGSIPEGVVVARELDIPFLCGGLGIGGKLHAPDEYILKGAYERLKKWFVVFLYQFALDHQGR